MGTKTKLDYLEELKVHPMYKTLWAKLKPVEKMFVTDVLTEWENLDHDDFYFKMNRLFIQKNIEKFNGNEYEKDVINPTQKVGDPKKVKHRMGYILDLLGSAANMQKNDR